MSKELTILDPKEFGIEEEKAIQVASSFNNKNEELLTYTSQYNEIIKLELTPENCKTAGDLRKKLVKVRTGISDVHKVEKAFYLAGGRFVDALKNKLTLTVEQMEEKLSEMEKHFEKLEDERKSKLKAERIAKLEPFGVDTQFISLADMTEEQFSALFENSKLAHETKLENERKSEAERLEAERLAEEKRQAELKAEQERIEAQRFENERLKKEAEEEKLRQEREIKEREKTYHKNSLVAIKCLKELGFTENDHGMSNDKLNSFIGSSFYSSFYHKEEIDAFLNQTKNDLEREKQRQEAQKKANDLQAENDRLKAEQEKERERIEAEEKERLAKEKALANAGDKEKVKHFFSTFKTIEFPELTSEDGKKMAVRVKEALAMVKQLIIDDSKSLL